MGQFAPNNVRVNSLNYEHLDDKYYLSVGALPDYTKEVEDMQTRATTLAVDTLTLKLPAPAGYSDGTQAGEEARLVKETKDGRMWWE